MPFSEGHALLIGVGTYQHEPRLNVPITAADAEAVADVLRDPAFCGYPADQVQVLRDEKASRDGILAALDALATRAGAGDTVLLFFCGHGDLGDDGDYYLTSHDTRLKSGRVVSGSGVRQGELIERLRAIKAKRLLLLVNACHSGELAPTLGPGEPPFTGVSLPSNAAAALLATGEGRIIITACREDQLSYIGNGTLTLFTDTLVNGLRGRGTSSSRGYISAFDLYTHLYFTIEETVRERYGAAQEPELTVLKGVGPFAVSLYRGATTLGEIDATVSPPEGTAVREVSAKQAQATFTQIIGPSYQANLRGNGAIAQGPGAQAVGPGGVLMGGKNTGSINTGTQIDTGGGAYVGGNARAGGDFVGRDKTVHGDIGILRNNSINGNVTIIVGGQQAGSTDETTTTNSNRKTSAETLRETIRLDVASPSTVSIGTEFDVAVAIRQLSSPALSIDDLDNRLSTNGIVERASFQEIVRYRVEILSNDFSIDPARLVFNLEYGRDSEVKWFKLTARRSGKLTFIVVAYQVDGDIEIASTRVTLKSVVESRSGSANDLESLFSRLLDVVAQHAPPEKEVEAMKQAQALKAEVAKGEQAEDGKMATIVNGLADLVPKAVGAIVSIFATPILSGIAGPVTKIVLDKIKGGSRDDYGTDTH